MAMPPQIVVRFRVDLSRNCSIGIGKIELLEAIVRTGSISKASRCTGRGRERDRIRQTDDRELPEAGIGLSRTRKRSSWRSRLSRKAPFGLAPRQYGVDQAKVENERSRVR